LRILLSAFDCSPLWGSEPATGWNWATELAKLGHEVTVLTVSKRRNEINSVGPVSNIDFHYIDLPETRLRRISDYLATFSVYGRWQQAALAHIRGRESRFDIAHHVTWGGLHLGSELWRLPIPFVFGPVGGGQTAPANYWRYFGRDWSAELLRTAATGAALKLNNRSRLTVQNSAVTLVDNSATALAAKRLGAKDVRYMLSYGLAPDTHGSARSQPTGTPVILYVGRLISRKAPTLAVEAFAELRRSLPARMVIAGDGPLRHKVQATVERLGLTKDVDILGHVPFTEIRQLYDSASVLLFSSLRESFGAPVLEALGRGLPTVGLDLHGIGDADMGSSVVKVALSENPQELPKSLATALESVLSDDEWASRSASGIKFTSNLLWPVKAAAATEIYRQLI
jgi:glycosyltransferase involved in cell wall biosynthesis